MHVVACGFHLTTPQRVLSCYNSRLINSGFAKQFIAYLSAILGSVSPDPLVIECVVTLSVLQRFMKVLWLMWLPNLTPLPFLTKTLL